MGRDELSLRDFRILRIEIVRTLLEAEQHPIPAIPGGFLVDLITSELSVDSFVSSSGEEKQRRHRDTGDAV